MGIIHIDKACDIANELRIAIFAALEDEAADIGKDFEGDLVFSRNRSISCRVYGANYAWGAMQFLYYARAIPEAFGYVTGYTDRGTIVVTTDAGEYVCEFKHPKKVEGRA